VGASRLRHACIIRTDIPVIAIGCSATDTESLGARVVCGARIAIITGQNICGIDAPGGCDTTVCGAHIVVIAVLCRCIRSHASALSANISSGACIAIITGNRIVYGDTAHFHVTGIIRTEIAVIAIGSRSTNTIALCTGILCATGIAIITGVAIVGVSAPFIRITAVSGARVVVVANFWLSSQALALYTGIADVAFIAIIARFVRDGLVDASLSSQATVIGTLIIIVTIYRRATLANSVLANVSFSAYITVIASNIYIIENTVPCCQITIFI